MLKDVGMTVPKSRETRAVYTYAVTRGMRACNNNNMRNLKLKDVGRVTHVIVVACPHPLCLPYILQHFNGNVFTLVSPIFH